MPALTGAPRAAARHERRPVSLRHVKRGLSTDAGAVPWLGHYLVPQPLEGLNTPGAWTGGEYEVRLGEEGSFTLELPNDVGADELLHRKRFSILTDPGYEAGDEWIEIYEGDRPGIGDPVFVGTPTEKEVTPSRITLQGFDVLELGKTIRETAGGFWAHAPRDVWEFYAGSWRPVLADDFATGLSSRYEPDVDLSIVNGRLRMHFDDSPIATAILRLSALEHANYTVRLKRTGDNFVVPAWRVEAHLRRLTNRGAVNLAMETALGAATYIDFRVETPGSGVGGEVEITVAGLTASIAATKPPTAPGDVSLAIESRDKWLLFYLDGQLVHVSAQPVIAAGSSDRDLAPRVQVSNEGPGTEGDVELLGLILRRWTPLMLGAIPDHGDYKIPGSPTANGILVEYFDDRDLASSSSGARLAQLLNPMRTPIHRRIEQTIDSRPAGALPPDVPPDHVSARWVGAIFCPLAGTDVRLRALNAEDRVRVWVGATRDGEQYIDSWTQAGVAATTFTGAGLRTLYPLEDAWLPIVVEWSNTGPILGGVTIEYELGTSPGTWVKLGTAPCLLSPLGIYQDKVRGASFYEQLRALQDTWGFQARVVPRPLGHPAFPGEFAPRVRQGRDTDRVIDDVVGGEPVVKANSRDVVHSLTADAAGLAAEGAQLSIEQIDYARALAHPIFHGDQISLAEISYPQLLAQRLQTLQTLRRTAWEEVSVQPDGATELVDSFRLPGSLARFRWEPGDGVRLAFDAIDVVDAAPRQITGVRRAIAQSEHGDPDLAFRPRPRGPRSQLRDLARQQAAARRTFQGQLVERTGSIGGYFAPATPGALGADDQYSRIALPDDLDAVVSALLLVDLKTDASSWTLEVNGVSTGKIVNSIGPVDIRPYVKRDGVNPRLYARLIPGVAAAYYRLVFIVRI